MLFKGVVYAKRWTQGQLKYEIARNNSAGKYGLGVSAAVYMDCECWLRVTVCQGNQWLLTLGRFKVGAWFMKGSHHWNVAL